MENHKDNLLRITNEAMRDPTSVVGASILGQFLQKQIQHSSLVPPNVDGPMIPTVCGKEGGRREGIGGLNLMLILEILDSSKAAKRLEMYPAPLPAWYRPSSFSSPPSFPPSSSLVQTPALLYSHVFRYGGLDARYRGCYGPG
jgi:hypothetical protein